MNLLIKPIISEKSLIGIQSGKYVFKVASKANGNQIKKAVKDLYKVDVIKVNCLNVKPEQKMIRGRFPGKIRGFKKAIVTLKKGQKIPGFEEK